MLFIHLEKSTHATFAFQTKPVVYPIPKFFVVRLLFDFT